MPLRREEGTARRVEAYLKLGDKAAQAQPPDYQRAAWAYRWAVESDPKDVRPHQKLGEVYAAQRDYERAVLSYNEALRLKPKKAELHYELGVIFQKMGETAAAREKLQLLREMKKTELAAELEAQLNAPSRP